jgi:hypothetical protein
MTNELSPIFLRPDFEEQHKVDFRSVLWLYHRFHFIDAINLYNVYLNNTSKLNAASRSSFSIIYHLKHINEPLVYPNANPEFSNFSDGHIEELISRLAHVAREWLHQNAKDDVERKSTLDKDIPFAFDIIQEWIPMPPVAGALVTDMKVSMLFTAGRFFI